MEEYLVPFAKKKNSHAFFTELNHSLHTYIFLQADFSNFIPVPNIRLAWPTVS